MPNRSAAPGNYPQRGGFGPRKTGWPPDLYTYNYFSGMPAAYAFTAPMLTGIATILLILLCTIWLLRQNNKMIGKVTAGVSLLSVLFSAGVVLLTEYSRNAVTFGVVALMVGSFVLLVAACHIQK